MKKAIIDKLNNWREVQRVTGPHLCLASSKFFAGKLTGLFDPSTHVNTFLNSAWASKHGSRWGLSFAWGKLNGEADFNSRVLPAAIANASAGVANPNGRWRNVEFHHFYGHEGWADSLLLGRVPLVVGVNYLGGHSLDHYITVLRSADFSVWAVDPWETSTWASVVELPMDFSFKNPQRFKLNASGVDGSTRIPSTPAYFGFYRDKLTKAPIGISRMI